MPLATTVKSLVLATDRSTTGRRHREAQVWLLLLRGDHDMNEVKVGKVPGLDAGFRFATVPRSRPTSAPGPATSARSA